MADNNENNDNGEFGLAENTVAETKKEHYAPEIAAKAQELSYFQVDRPNNAIEGISSGEYNLIKGAVAGPVMMLTAPVIGAMEESSRGKTALEKVQKGCIGFGNGLVRGVTGGTAIAVTGTITGLNQLKQGLLHGADAPGQGRGWKENWEHLVNSSYTHIATNTEPENFRSELDALIAEGKLPAKKFDVEGREVPHTYQFFLTDEPDDFMEGFNAMQYNVGKGWIAGFTLAASAPFLDAKAKYEETNEKGEAGGVEGAVAGFGSGVFRGFVGGAVLAGAGMWYGASQVSRGFTSLHNLPKGAQFVEKVSVDYSRLTKDPIYNLALQKGYGLEEFLIKEEERLRAYEEEKRQWLEAHPGETHPDDVVEVEEPAAAASESASASAQFDENKAAQAAANESPEMVTH